MNFQLVPNSLGKRALSSSHQQTKSGYHLPSSSAGEAMATNWPLPQSETRQPRGRSTKRGFGLMISEGRHVEFFGAAPSCSQRDEAGPLALSRLIVNTRSRPWQKHASPSLRLLSPPTSHSFVHDPALTILHNSSFPGP